MNEINDIPSHPEDWHDHPQPTSSNTLTAEAWDRRERDAHAPTLELLSRATRYLIHDQMRADRTYNPGAWAAVELLWAAMTEVEQARVTRQRVERLSSIWLPQQILARIKGPGPSH